MIQILIQILRRKKETYEEFKTRWIKENENTI